jgi:hypothetical protein
VGCVQEAKQFLQFSSTCAICQWTPEFMNVTYTKSLSISILFLIITFKKCIRRGGVTILRQTLAPSLKKRLK